MKPTIMRRGITALVAFGGPFVMLTPSTSAADISVHSIIASPKSFDHQTVTLQGTAVGVRETTSHRGNDYTTFKLRDPSSGDTVSIFTWGHPTLASCDHVQVDGVFETEHHQGRYTFYNEVEATKVTCLSQ